MALHKGNDRHAVRYETARQIEKVTRIEDEFRGR
jgi:hypothetical protein